MRELRVFVSLALANVITMYLTGHTVERYIDVTYFEGLGLFVHWVIRKIDHE